MKVVLAGGSGFLGSALTAALVARGDEVVLLSRGLAPMSTPVRRVVWRPDASIVMGQPSQEWARELDGADVVVNLAGAGIADRRWTAARKRLLHHSRIASTRQLIGVVRGAARRPAVFVQGSAIGYYGPHGDEQLDESSPPGRDFLARLCRDWEQEAQAAATFGCRLVTIRTGIVLARDGGALKKMLLPFRLGLGGPIASGRQYMSWIHRDDWVALMMQAIDTKTLEGAVNATAPVPVTNAEFTRALGAALHRPTVIPVPGVALRVMFGELADASLINGQRVMPARAQAMGFVFRYPAIGPALAAALAH